MSRSVRTGAVLILAWGLMHVVAGFQIGLRAWLGPAGFFDSLGVPSADLSAAPRLTAVTRGISAIWSGALVGLGVLALVLGAGPYRRGERWAWWTLLFGLGPADLGAAIFWRAACPPAPMPAMLATGIGLFVFGMLIPARAILGDGAPARIVIRPAPGRPS